MNKLKLEHVDVVWNDDGELNWDSEYGEACFLLCFASATVSYPTGYHNSRRIETLTSGGLGGIPRPSPDDKRNIEEEQLLDLRLHLEVFGVIVSDEEWKGARR